MEEITLIKIVVSGALGLILVGWYVVFAILLIKNRDTQPVKSKAPKLLLASLIGNLLSLLTVLAMIFLVITELIKEPLLYAHMGIVLSECVFAPVMFSGYIFRAVQLSKIFNAPKFAKPTNTRSSWFSQGLYLKVILLLFFIFAACGGWLGYNFIRAQEDEDIHKGFDHILIITTMTISFLGTFFFCVYGLRTLSRKKYDVEIRTELAAIVIFWTCCSCGFHFLIIRENGEKLKEGTETLVIVMSSVIILLRDLVSFIISVVSPILRSREGRIIPYGETRECVNNVEITLATELPFLYFSHFIESVAGETGKNIITLYTQIKLYEDKVENGLDQVEAFGMATLIENDYLHDYSEMKIEDIPTEVKESLVKKFENLRVHLDKHLFDSLYGVVINKLQEYFVLFKQSEVYLELQDELKNNEVIYERLVNAELI